MDKRMIIGIKTVRLGDLVSVKFVGGEWGGTSRAGQPIWKKNNKPSYYFGTVAEFRGKDQYDSNAEIKINVSDSTYTNSDNPMWKWEKPNDISFICSKRKLKRIVNE